MNTLITKGKRAAFPLMLLSTLLFSNTLLAQTAPEVLRKPVGKGAYEMAYSPSENALYGDVAEPQAGQGRHRLPSGSDHAGRDPNYP